VWMLHLPRVKICEMGIVNLCIVLFYTGLNRRRERMSTVIRIEMCIKVYDRRPLNGHETAAQRERCY
jgi:hypothetical protein